MMLISVYILYIYIIYIYFKIHDFYHSQDDSTLSLEIKISINLWCLYLVQVMPNTK